MSKTISDYMVTKHSGQYDKEVIQRLKLENLGIHFISNLDQCFSLIELSLNHNEISDMRGLEHLVSLKRLDLSFNKIRKIENLQDLLCLEYLDLRANSIASIYDIEQLKPLIGLQCLYFQSSEGEDSNPACQHPSYITVILRSLPELKLIDGGHLNVREAFSSLEDHMKLIQPDPSACATPPLQPWFDGLIIENNSNGQQEEEDLDAWLVSITGQQQPAQQFKALTTTHQHIYNIINEDCSHLLRKAQAAVTKATK